MRVVPRSNEAINETWISDRDRFSYEGIYAADRLTRPMVREGGEWRKVDWQTALTRCANGLQAAGAGLDTLVSASATAEEQYLAARLTRALGSNSIDHRLRQVDFRGDGDDCCSRRSAWQSPMSKSSPGSWSWARICAWNCRCSRTGSGRRRESGAKVAFVNPAAFDYLFPGDRLRAIVVCPAGRRLGRGDCGHARSRCCPAWLCGRIKAATVHR